MLNAEMTVTMSKILSALKRGEKCKVEIKNSFVQEEDPDLEEILKECKQDDESLYDPSKPLFAHVELLRLVKMEDWFKDGSTIAKTLRKGKGRSPYTDSVVKARLQVLVNGKELLSNYPATAPKMKASSNEEEKEEEAKENDEEPTPYSFHESENLRPLSADERKQYLEKAEGLYTIRMDTYCLPSLMIKMIKSMKKNGVLEVTTTRIDKLKTNFANEELGFDQYQEGLLNEGDEVLFRITLLDSTHPMYFYKMLVKDKLEHILRLKNTATRFFKSNLPNGYKKAADLYQRINGYYNFGDATNNYAKEDESDPEFISNNTQLQALKLTSFNNLVVCKFKQQEWQSIIGITDQILGENMDPNNIKALYFRG